MATRTFKTRACSLPAPRRSQGFGLGLSRVARKGGESSESEQEAGQRTSRQRSVPWYSSQRFARICACCVCLQSEEEGRAAGCKQGVTAVSSAGFVTAAASAGCRAAQLHSLTPLRSGFLNGRSLPPKKKNSRALGLQKGWIEQKKAGGMVP